jgi:hypothetical protein
MSVYTHTYELHASNHKVIVVPILFQSDVINENSEDNA